MTPHFSLFLALSLSSSLALSLSSSFPLSLFLSSPLPPSLSLFSFPLYLSSPYLCQQSCNLVGRLAPAPQGLLQPPLPCAVLLLKAGVVVLQLPQLACLYGRDMFMYES